MTASSSAPRTNKYTKRCLHRSRAARPSRCSHRWKTRRRRRPHSRTTRTPNVNGLPPGPFQLTPAIPYDAYTGDPVHRFYQMWQQLDCSVEHATHDNPSGCTNDLFAWVEQTVSTGSNGNPPPTPLVDREGARALGFYNVQAGDAPYFKYIADTYAMSDNFHQAIQGGTEANHVALGTGDRSGLATARVARSCRPSSTRKIPIRSRAQTTITRKTVTPAGRTA